MPSNITRRESITMLGSGMALAASHFKPLAGRPLAQVVQSGTEEQANRVRRLKWWHEAKFGMFVHWGLFSVLGRGEAVLAWEGIPMAEYELLAKQFVPKPNAARAWAKLAKQAGMKYMVLTTKHLEGFCLFDSKYTDYSAPQQACGRDLVREYVEAAWAEGLRVGFYYSLSDYHHPDGARCAHDEAARKRMVEYVHGQIRELLTNYGRVDILWYDSTWPMDPKRWESERMNRMVFQLQPEILVNDRNFAPDSSAHPRDFEPGDYSTLAEQKITPPQQEDRAWESDWTMNETWGYHKGDDAWRTPKTIIRTLIAIAQGGGNYLLNIGPRGDGSIPEEPVRILTEAGRWMDKHGQTIYGAERSKVIHSQYANFTRKGNTLYMHVYFWPGQAVALGGDLGTKVKSVRLFTTGQKLSFRQEDYRLQITGLPERAPDDLATVIAIQCESEPRQMQRPGLNW